MGDRIYNLDSLAAAADEAKRYHTGRFSDGSLDQALGVSFNDALKMAREGWTEQLPETLAIAESAVILAEQEHMMDSFSQPAWDVTGAEVDVARYLSGEPECMIDFPLTKTSKQGRVITLVVSGTTSSAISGDTILRRGQLMVALTLALSRLGHAVELWWNFHGAAKHHGQRSVGHCEVSVKVKGVNDELDPAAIMFAYAHPAMQRRISFGITERCCTVHSVMEPTRELYPEGSIFLPALESAWDVPDADEFLKKYLGELGLLAE